MLGDFNNDTLLWRNAREAHRQTRATFEVSKHGAVWKRGGAIERVAQFADEATALKTLTEAGYKRTGNVFRP